MNLKSINLHGFKHSFYLVLLSAMTQNINIRLDNCPQTLDRSILIDFYKNSGKSIIEEGNTISLSKKPVHDDYYYGELNKVHSSAYVIPINLAVHGKAKLFESGGCKIDNEGQRKTNHVNDILLDIGVATIDNDGNLIENNINESLDVDLLKYSTHSSILAGEKVSGITKTLLLYCFSKRISLTLYNPYLKAEVLELLEFYKNFGFEVLVDDSIIILNPTISNISQVNFTIHDDIPELFTFVTMNVYMQSDINIKYNKIDERYISNELKCYSSLGIDIIVDPEDKIIKLKYNSNYNSKIIFEYDFFNNDVYSDIIPFICLLLIYNSRPFKIKDHIWNKRINSINFFKSIEIDCDISVNDYQFYTGKETIKENILSNLPECIYGDDLRNVACIYMILYKYSLVEKLKDTNQLIRGYTNFYENINKY